MILTANKIGCGIKQSKDHQEPKTKGIDKKKLTIKGKDGLDKEMWLTLNKNEKKAVVIIGDGGDSTKYKEC